MNKKTNSKIFYYIFIAFLIILVFFAFTNVNTSGEKLSYNQAINYFEDDKVEGWYLVGTSKIVFDLSEDVVTKTNVTSEQFPKKSDAYIVYQHDEFTYLFENYQNRLGDPTKDTIYRGSEQPTGSILDWLPTILFLTFGGILLYVLIKSFSSKGNGAMGFGKSRARAVTNISVRFSDIAGADEEKEELKEIVEFLKNPKKFTELGARIPKGVLLVGPPGTGKTLLARAVAGESNVPFLSISGSDFVEMFVGVGASRVRDLFEQANKSKPCIIFIDEIDAVGRQRGAGLGGSNDEREQTLNQMLVELDGFEANTGIIVLAATNRVDVLDPALLRPGRFDRQIYVHEPDVKGREGIIRIHAKNKPLAEDVDFNVLARITSGFTGADLENMLNEAAILAARANRPRIIMEDITEGINKVIMGPQKKSRLVTERDKKITAYHEAGHAILDKKLEYTQEVQEVSIISRGMAAGYTMVRPDTDDNHVTLNFLNDQIASFMGGRIAEELVFKDFTTGASNDIQRATQLARRMVTEWGMSSKFGFMSLESDQQVFIGRDYQNKNLYSEKTAGQIDEEIQAILDYNYKRAKKIVQENMPYIEQIVALLLEKETIYKNEIDMILEGKTNEEIIEEMNKKEKKRLAKEKKEKELKQKLEKMKELEVKLKTSEIFLKHGLISEDDYKEIVDLRNKYTSSLTDETKKTNSKKKTSTKTKKTNSKKKASTKTKKVKTSNKDDLENKTNKKDNK